MLLDLVIYWFYLLLKLLQFLKISNNFYNGFFEKPYKNVGGLKYLLVLVINKIITIFES